jgi:hypothetical protein
MGAHPSTPTRLSDPPRARTQRECEAQVLRIAVQVAIVDNPETLDPEISRLPGRERARRFGGVGTPDVAEFAAAAPGGRLGISTGSAHSLMADALDLMIRQPFPGIYVWRDPYGATYLVDHSGTRRLRARPELSPAEAEVSRALFELAA